MSNEIITINFNKAVNALPTRRVETPKNANHNVVIAIKNVYKSRSDYVMIKKLHSASASNQLLAVQESDFVVILLHLLLNRFVDDDYDDDDVKK